MNNLLSLVQSYSQKFDTALKSANAIRDEIQNQRDEFRAAFDALSEHAFLADADPALLKEFLDKPYVLLPVAQDKYWLIVPRFLKFTGGWAIRTIGAFNVFEITRFINFINPLPDWLAEQVNFQKPTWQGTFDGNDLIVTRGAAGEVARKFGGAVRSVTANRIHLKAASRFDVIRRIIRDDGILPFAPAPIPVHLQRRRAEFVARDDNGAPLFTLRSYQQRAFDKLLELGRESLFWYGQTGKSFVALEACAALHGPKLILCPTRTLRDQWLNVRLPLLADAARREVMVDTYHNLAKYRVTDWTLIVADEAHHLPANLFIEAALLKTQAVLGLSATPVREDGNEDLIPALCGFPNADYEMTATQKPRVHVWVVKDLDAKLKHTAQLVEKPIPGKTFIFTWKLEIGEAAAKKLDVPFISGATKKPLDIINANDTVVISKVGDAGLSFPVDRIIEIDFQFGSRQEAGQRLLRAANDTEREAEFHTLMTPHEFHTYGKRLLMYEQWGLEISYHDLTGKMSEPNGHAARTIRPISARTVPRAPRVALNMSRKDASRVGVSKRANDSPAAAALALPAIKNKIAQVTTKVHPRVAAYIPRIFTMCFDHVLSVNDIADALQIKSAAPKQKMQYAAREMVAIGLLKTDGHTYQVNPTEIERAKQLARLVA